MYFTCPIYQDGVTVAVGTVAVGTISITDCYRIFESGAFSGSRSGCGLLGGGHHSRSGCGLLDGGHHSWYFVLQRHVVKRRKTSTGSV